MNSELHPLEPFLPANARVLMLGSFPPKRIRWSMDFFYPNLQNDMWRIVGYLATGDKSHFLMPGGRKFDKERIDEPAVGQSIGFEYAGRNMRLWRMPSSSRAYPRPVEWKAEFYRKVFEMNEIL